MEGEAVKAGGHGAPRVWLFAAVLPAVLSLAVALAALALGWRGRR
jgi:hypothetical protein